jgi:catechol 2,3-dioxygenase-like lactoylglutathione lyase family enzyme
MNGSGLSATGLSHFVIEVGDLSIAEFYRDSLGFTEAGHDVISNCPASVALAGADGGFVVLAKGNNRPDLNATGVHQAYRIGAESRDRIKEALIQQGITVHTYKEDRPAEEDDPLYFTDPAGNRVQLVTGNGADSAPALDHAAVQVANMWWAEEFYTKTLTCEVEHRVGWKTADYARAQLWADGKEDMAPGTRRMDKRYTSMVKNREMPRVNLQLYLRIGQAPFGVYLSNQHFQEPPEENLVGTPRTAFAVSADMIDDTCRRLEAARWPFKGPVAHGGGSIIRSLYFKDPGGNFIELAQRADA